MKELIKILYKKIIKHNYCLKQDNGTVSEKDILIISSYSKPSLSITHKLLKTSLDYLKNKYKFNYKIINLYSYKIPFYKLNKKPSKDFISLTQILDKYSIYLFIFPVWYSNVPAVLKNFVDWSGHWGTEKNVDGKIVGKLKGKKVAIITSCWDKRKEYIKKLSSAINYQLIESVFSFFKMKHIQTLIIQDSHNHKQKNLSLIENNIMTLITLMNKTSA